MSGRWLRGLALLVAIALAGCGKSGAAGAAPSAAPTPQGAMAAPATAAPPASSAAAPAFAELRAVALGGANLCLLGKDQAVRCLGDWPIPLGANGSRNQDVRAPLTVSGLGNPRVMVVAQHRACAIVDDGTVRCWGNTVPTPYGWTGAAEGKLEAVPVDGVRDAVGIALGWAGSCALTKQGRMRCWGPAFRASSSKQTTVPAARTLALESVTQISADKMTLCALRKDGTVHCLGDDETRFVAVNGLADVVQISVGDSHRCALTKAGEALCWGANDRGQLGDGTLDERSAPVRVAGLSNVIQVEASHGFSCALTRDGKVFCWGDGGNCVLGDEHRACTKKTFGATMGPVEVEMCPSPQRVSIPIDPVRISLGSGSGCAIDAGGHVACWGRSFTDAPGTCRGEPLALH